MFGRRYGFGLIGVKEAPANDDGDAQNDIPRDVLAQDRRGQTHGDDGFDEESIGRGGGAAFFDSFHEAEVAEARNHETDVDQDWERIDRDAGDDWPAHQQHHEEFENRPDDEAKTIESHAAELADLSLAERRVETKHDGSAESHQDAGDRIARGEAPGRSDEQKTGDANEEDERFLFGEWLVRDKVRKDHREHGVERDQNRGQIGIGSHDGHLEEGHADDDVDEGQAGYEAPIATRHDVTTFFEITERKGKQAQPTDEKAQEGELKRIE